MSQYIDRQSISHHFPIGQTMPKRLIEFLDWLDSEIKDVGWFPEFTGDDLDGYAPDIDLSPYFGVFVHLGDGSCLAYWFYETCDRDNPPIVMLTSDGEMGVLAESIEELVARIIERQFPDTCWADPLGDFYFYPDETWVQKLEMWAKETWDLTFEYRQELIAASAATKHPDLEKWMNDKI